LLLPMRAEVQDEVRHARLQRQGEPRRRRPVGDRLRAEAVDRRGRGQDQRAREASGELRTDLATDRVICNIPVAYFRGPCYDMQYYCCISFTQRRGNK